MISYGMRSEGKTPLHTGATETLSNPYSKQRMSRPSWDFLKKKTNEKDPTLFTVTITWVVNVATLVWIHSLSGKGEMAQL